MVNPVKYGVLAVVLALTSACAGPQRSASDPAPQRAFNDRSAQQPNAPVSTPNAPVSTDQPSLQRPFNDPAPQSATLETPQPQAPIHDPKTQKPFYGPGLTTPAGESAAKTERPLTDAEVLGVVSTANEGEVQMAEVALKRASAADVKQFAGMMKTHHTAALQKTKAVQARTKLDSTASDLSALLENDASKTIKELRTKTGAEFDRAYIDSQVKAHRDVLTAIDSRLGPSATNGEVKALLGEIRRTVVDHLSKADDIEKKLDPSVSTSSK